MKRRHLISTAPLVATSALMAPPLLAAPVSAETVPSATMTGSVVETHLDRWSVAKKLQTPPAMDGTVKDPVWSDARQLRGFLTPYFNDAVDEKICVKLAYDSSNLYLAFEYTAADGGAALAAAEILISPSASGNRYFRIPVTITEVDPPHVNNWGPATTLTNLQTLTNKTSQGVTAEVRVPLASMGVTGIESGAEWRSNIIVQHRMMTKPLNSWVPIRAVRSTFLGGANAPILGEVTTDGRLGSVYMGELPGQAAMWKPDDFSLAYVGFTEKAIAFRRGDIGTNASIGLAWKMADGLWEPVDGQVTTTGDTIGVSFEHPPPRRNGLYGLRVRIEQPSGTTPHKLCVVTFDRNALIAAGDALYAEAN